MASDNLVSSHLISNLKGSDILSEWHLEKYTRPATTANLDQRAALGQVFPIQTGRNSGALELPHTHAQPFMVDVENPLAHNTVGISSQVHSTGV